MRLVGGIPKSFEPSRRADAGVVMVALLDLPWGGSAQSADHRRWTPTSAHLDGGSGGGSGGGGGGCSDDSSALRGGICTCHALDAACCDSPAEAQRMLRQHAIRKVPNAAAQRGTTGVGALPRHRGECSPPLQPQQPQRGGLPSGVLERAEGALQCDGGVLVQQG